MCATSSILLGKLPIFKQQKKQINQQLKFIIMKTKIKALAQFLDCKKSEISQSSYDENTFEYGSQEYLVVTDEEADELWDESLNNYLEECIYPELNGNLSNYFDDEKWKRDAKYDGRGHSLSGYDGCENYETVNGETLYIYRTN